MIRRVVMGAVAAVMLWGMCADAVGAARSEASDHSIRGAASG